MMMASDLTSSEEPKHMLPQLDFQYSHVMYRAIGRTLPPWLLLGLEHSGNGFIWIPGAMIAVLWPGLRWRIKIFAINLEAGFLLDVIVVGVIKVLVKRPRPDYADKQYNAAIPVDKYSFPSGHASRCILIACMVFFFRATCHPAILVAVALWAVTTALSRVALGRHYLFDVVAGSIIGVMLAGLLSKVCVLWRSTHALAYAACVLLHPCCDLCVLLSSWVGRVAANG